MRIWPKYADPKSVRRIVGIGTVGIGSVGIGTCTHPTTSAHLVHKLTQRHCN